MLESNKEILCAVLGGSLMAMASSLNLWLTGKLTGFSSILSSVLTVNKDDVTHSFSAVTAVVTTSLLANKFLGSAGYIQVPIWKEWLPLKLFDRGDELSVPLSATAVFVGGVMVGFGTRLGNGCTSGHGVCGLPRLSRRSITAVCTFMAVGMATATTIAKRNFVVPDIGIIESMQSMFLWNPSHYTAEIVLVMGAVMTIKWTQDRQQIKQSIVSFATASIFTTGLLLSGMTQVSKILSFLTVDDNWNISLMFVMASAVSINFVTFTHILQKRTSPVLNGSTWAVPSAHASVDWRLVAGAAIFGAGWGISGACPAPVIALSVLTEKGYFGLLSVAIGMYLYELFKYVEAKMSS